MPALPILTAARRYLSECLAGKQSPWETTHPWRKPWQFTYTHCLRVERLAIELLAAQVPALPADEVLALRLAAILHDIARLDPDEAAAVAGHPADGHAGRGAQIAAAWLARPDIAGQVPQPGLVIELIAQHSNKQQPPPHACHAILQDADTLDEIGAMSIFMCANWLDRSNPFFFQQLLERLKQRELVYCDRALGHLHTPAGQACLQNKRHFIEGFIAQLEQELEEANAADSLPTTGVWP